MWKQIRSMSMYDTVTPFTASVQLVGQGAHSQIQYKAAFHNSWAAAHFDWAVALLAFTKIMYICGKQNLTQ